MSKTKIFSMIEQGYCNTDIKNEVSCTLRHVSNMRTEFNRLSGLNTKSRIKKREKPKAGTNLRKAYDFFHQNKNATPAQTAHATGLNYNTVCSCYSRYFSGAAA